MGEAGVKRAFRERQRDGAPAGGGDRLQIRTPKSEQNRAIAAPCAACETSLSLPKEFRRAIGYLHLHQGSIDEESDPLAVGRPEGLHGIRSAAQGNELRRVELAQLQPCAEPANDHGPVRRNFGRRLVHGTDRGQLGSRRRDNGELPVGVRPARAGAQECNPAGRSREPQQCGRSDPTGASARLG